MSLGPVMLDLEGTALSDEERELLLHPLVGGVILFSRNYENPEQMAALLAEVHALRGPRLLVAVDHEGGRVQRFREGFVQIPAAASFGRIYKQDKPRAKRLAEAAGWVMASELRAIGVDFSFAPVLDLDYGVSEVIGERAFHRRPEVVAELAGAYMAGMRRAGMAAVGKHFPGHGAVTADSHAALPVDERPLQAILDEDARPFEILGDHGLAGVMPAHVLYTQADTRPAGFSAFGLKRILRERLGFHGIIFSDDLNMEGAGEAGGPSERAAAALAAGCDMVLICNNRPAALQILRNLEWRPDPVLHARLVRLHGKHPVTWNRLHADAEFQRQVAALEGLNAGHTLDLDLES